MIYAIGSIAITYSLFGFEVAQAVTITWLICMGAVWLAAL